MPHSLRTFLAAALLALLAAIPARAEFAEINGVINWLEGASPPLNAVIVVELVNVDTERKGGEVLASLTMSPEGAAPLPFRLVYDRRLTGRKGTYRLIASARLGDLELMRSLRAVTAVGAGSAATPEILLEPMKLGRAQGEETPVDRSWRLVRVRDDVPPPTVRATLMLGDDGLVSGSSGCNRFTGSYDISPEVLLFGPLAQTKRGCQSPVMRVERKVSRALDKVRSWRIQNGRLLLLDIAGSTLLEYVEGR